MRGATSRPTIGVTAATEHVSYGAWSGLPAFVSPASYVRTIQRAGEDGTVEALEDPSRPFVLGVLWHPEEDEKSQLINSLVSEVS